jgi:tetratricopeptide (TPR) repeat protein
MLCFPTHRSIILIFAFSPCLQLALEHVHFDIQRGCSFDGGKVHLEVPALLCLCASVLRREGRNEEALQVYEEAVEISKELYGPSVITATCLNNMAFLAFHMQLLQKSRAIFLDAFAVLVDVHGHNDPRLVPILNNIGRVEESLGDFEAAQGFYTRALDISANDPAKKTVSAPGTQSSVSSPYTTNAPKLSSSNHLFALWLQKRAGSGFIVVRVRAVNLTKARNHPRFLVEFGLTKVEPPNFAIVVGASRSSHKEEFFPSLAEQSVEFRDTHSSSTPVVFSLFERRPLSGQKLVCSCSTPLHE